jgi:biopolymer transport protein ExbD
VETAGKNEFRGNVTISIDKDGKLTFNGKEISDAELPAALQAVKDVSKDIPVLIRSDEKATLDRLTFVWDACRKVGLNKHSLQSR